MTRKKQLLSIVLCLAGFFAASRYPLAQAREAQSSPVDFARDIRPILEANCFRCHGPERAMASLRLDQTTGLLHVIKAGNSHDSRLLKRILGEGGEERMPLASPPLSEASIALIRKWIDAGAATSETSTPARVETQHWAYKAPVRPPLPQTRNQQWARNEIDRFVLARLEKETLNPSSQADRATLLRRLSLDLIGLPPTIAEVDQFLHDQSPNAYEKQVDRLLASPHFGERWGRRWLDAARYADSDGYEKDKQREVWFYRDWVINALNADMPYDRFVIEQIAGDRLPNPTQDQMVATGFLRNSMINEEGGIDPEQFRMEAMFDRIDAIGKSVLGLTIQCAQCHNHKYDPLKQEEYYRLFAFLNNSHESQIPVYTPEQEMKRAEIFRVTREIEGEMKHRLPDWQARESQWEEEVKRSKPQWNIARPTVEDISTGGQRYLPLDDGSFLALGYAPTKHRVKLVAKTDAPLITAFRVELLTDANLPFGGPGRSPSGGCALTEFDVEVAPANKPESPRKLKISHATSSFDQPERELEAIFDDRSNNRRVTGGIKFAIDGRDETAWGIDAGPGQRNQTREAVFVLAEPLRTSEPVILNFYLKQNHGGWNSNDNQNNNLGRFRLSITGADHPVADPVPPAVREAIALPASSRTPMQDAAVFGYWRTLVPELRDGNARIAELWKQYPEPSSQLVLSERDGSRETHILKRGDFLKPDKLVNPGVPSYLHQLPANAAPDRLTFARWLVDRRSPTTARAIVNRIWQEYFGTGLVSTPEDLGRQGERPSHPELLDWLAVELMENGWHLKHIHRLIATSATYMQSSAVSPELLKRDPDNRLLARSSRIRVDGEIIRDIALASSGLLNEKIGGPSVYPPSPEFLYQPPASYGTKNWPEEKGADRYRRALYTFRYRSVPYPALQVFDTPTSDVSCVRRSRSNTPLQALTTLNETLFLEAARALALRTIGSAGPTDSLRATYCFRSVLSRRPTVAEANELLGLLNRQRQRFKRGELNPWNLAINDPDKAFKLPVGTSMEDLAAWTAVARVVLNLDEAMTKD
jgi:mono/diheme cytochrome c family protein